MSSPKIRIGLLGAGDSGSRHACAAIAIPGVEIAWVADMDSKRAASLVQRVVPDARPLAPEDALDEDVHLVIICTPPSEHVCGAKAHLERHRHVLVEKPLALTLDSLDDIATTARAVGKKVYAVCQHRTSEATRRLQQIANERLFGRPQTGDLRVYRNRTDAYYGQGWKGRAEVAGGGVLISLAFHLLDVAISAFGTPRRVCAISMSAHKTSVEATIVGGLEFDGGFLVALRAAAGLGPSQADEIDVVFERERVCWRSDKLWVAEQLKVQHDKRVSLYASQLAQVVACMRGEEEKAADLDDVRPALATIFALYRAAATGRTVEVQP